MSHPPKRKETVMRKHRHEHALMLLAVALAVVFAITGCNGAKQGGDAGDGGDAEKVEQTNDGNAGGGGAGGDIATSDGGVTTTIATLDGWWKVTSNKSMLWDYSGDKLDAYQRQTESAGAFKVDAAEKQFSLSTVGGNLNGHISEEANTDEFMLEPNEIDGFSMFKSATCKMSDNNTLTITIDDTPTADEKQMEGMTEDSDFAQMIEIQCVRTDEYAADANIYDLCEELHAANRALITDNKDIQFHDGFTVVGTGQGGEIRYIAHGETDKEVIVVLGVFTKDTRWVMINNSTSNRCIVNDHVKVKNPVYTILPANNPDTFGQDPSQDQGRLVALHLDKAAIGENITSVRGVLEYTTLDWVPLENIEFRVTI